MFLRVFAGEAGGRLGEIGTRGWGVGCGGDGWVDCGAVGRGRLGGGGVAGDGNGSRRRDHACCCLQQCYSTTARRSCVTAAADHA